MPLKIRPLSKPLQEKAEREFNEIAAQIDENVEHLRNWLLKQEHIKSRKDDQLLLNFLRGSKYSLQRAKEKLDAYYTFRTIAPEIAKNLDPLLPDMQAILKAGIYIPLPIEKDDPSGPRTFLIRFGHYNPEEITLTTILKGDSLNVDILINEDDNFAISGVNALCDMKGMQLKTAIQVTPTMLKKIVYSHEKAYPTRVKSIHLVNVPKFIEQLLNAFKMLVSKKLANRIHFHSSNDWDSIHKVIPKSILPQEYGGEAGLADNMAAEWKKTIESHRERLLAENNYYSEESKRPGKQNTYESFFGVEGSFRKLELD